MCGIAGGVALQPADRPDQARIRAISARLAHRGPDGEGLWISPSGRACFAHRRLSVIDLATGQQPMLDETGTLGLVFNGEIYNYVELRNALRTAGERFRTTSDTEVLLKLLARGGAGCLESLRGMFAFAAWDDRRANLTFARDAVGKKPLYHVVEDGCLYFASSVAALRATSRRRWEIDPVALDLYFTLGYIPAPLTIYREVRKLPSATVATLDGSVLRLDRFWDPAADDGPYEGTYEEALGHLEELLDRAVRIRLRSDVPLGVFLSGGIDLSLVTAIAARHAGAAVETFSIGFDESGFDESGYAESVAGHLAARHRRFRVRTELLDLLPNLAWHYGEPFADSSALPSWVLAEHVRRYVTVALAGDGGDEGFAGYAWYRTAAKLSALARGIPAGAARAAARGLALAGAGRGSISVLGRLERGLGVLGCRGAAERFAALRSFVSGPEAERLYRGELRDLRRTSASGDALLSSTFERAGGAPLRKMRYADIMTYLADDLMTKVDVASMAHGLEVRAPLLDQDLLRFALSLPDAFLVDGRGGKRILRDLLARHLPPALFERPKQGFSVPLSRWFAGPLRSRMERLAESEPLNALGLLSSVGIRSLVAEHAAGLRDHSQRLFSLLMFEEWLRGQGPDTHYAERAELCAA